MIYAVISLIVFLLLLGICWNIVKRFDIAQPSPAVIDGLFLLLALLIAFAVFFRGLRIPNLTL